MRMVSLSFRHMGYALAPSLAANQQRNANLDGYLDMNLLHNMILAHLRNQCGEMAAAFAVLG